MKDWCINHCKNRKYMVVICKTSLLLDAPWETPQIHLVHSLHSLPTLNLFWLGIYSYKGKNNAEKFSRSTTRMCKFRSNIKMFHWTPLLTRSGIIHCRNSFTIKLNFQLALLEFNTKKGKFQQMREWPDKQWELKGNVNFKSMNTCVLTNIIKHAFYPKTRTHLCLTHRTGSEDPEILQDTGTSGILLQNISLRWSKCQQCTALGHTNKMKQHRVWAKDPPESPLPELPYKNSSLSFLFKIRLTELVSMSIAATLLWRNLTLKARLR